MTSYHLIVSNTHNVGLGSFCLVKHMDQILPQIEHFKILSFWTHTQPFLVFNVSRLMSLRDWMGGQL